MPATVGAPMTFESDDIQVSSDGQLQSLHEQWGNEYHGNRNAGALGQGSIVADGGEGHAGVTFDVAKCASGFTRLVIGLTGKHDESPAWLGGEHPGSDPLDFSVHLDGNELFVDTLTIYEFGHKVHCMSSDGDESVTLRLNRAGCQFECLVNGTLVYSSGSNARFPLFCKVANRVVKGIHGITKTYSAAPGRGSMRLPVKGLHWSRARDKVVSLRVLDIGKTGIVTTTCTGLSGDEVARLDHDFGTRIADLKTTLQQQLTSLYYTQIVFLNESGCLLADSDTWPHDPPAEHKSRLGELGSSSTGILQH